MGRFKTVYWVTLAVAVLGIAFTLTARRTGNTDLNILGQVFTGYAAIWAALRMYRLGTMIRTVWGRINYLFLAATFVSFLMRLQHWPLGSLVSVVLLFVYPLYYTCWFATKKEKAVDDVLKVVWLWAHCLLAWAIIQHVVETTIWYTAADLALLFVTYYLVLRAFPKRWRPKEPEWDFDRMQP